MQELSVDIGLIKQGDRGFEREAQARASLKRGGAEESKSKRLQWVFDQDRRGEHMPGLYVEGELESRKVPISEAFLDQAAVANEQEANAAKLRRASGKETANSANQIQV